MICVDTMRAARLVNKSGGLDSGHRPRAVGVWGLNVFTCMNERIYTELVILYDSFILYSLFFDHNPSFISQLVVSR